MEQVVERGNMRRAYQRVVENKGAAGVDGMPVSELKELAEAALAEREAGTVGRPVFAAAGAAGGNPQAGGRGADARASRRWWIG